MLALRPTRALVAMAAVVALGASACASDNGSAVAVAPTTTTVASAGRDAACSARTDVKTAAQSLVDDVKSANFGQARDDVAKLGTALNDLRQAAGQLTSEQAAKLSPLVDQLRTTLTSLASVSSLQDLQTTLDSAKTTLGQIADSIGSALDCP